MSAGMRLVRVGLLLGALVTALCLVAVPAVGGAAYGSPADTAAASSTARQAASSPGHSPVPVYSSANGVSCPRASYCLAVGAYTVDDVANVLTQLWNGSAWSVIPSSRPSNAESSVLSAISCTSASYCVAVGSFTDGDGMSWALTELWNGWSWKVVGNPASAGGTDAALSGVSCAGRTFCMAVGTYTDRRSVPVTLTERWNGVAWSIVSSRNPAGAASSALSAVSCVGRTFCQATGSDIDANSDGVILIESWNGSAWSILRSPRPSGAQSGSLDGISCPSPSRCVAVGAYFDSDFVAKTLAESWNGSAWSVAASPSPAGSPSSAFYGVACGTAGSCVAVGHSYRRTAAAKDGALVETWDGSSWALVAGPSPSTNSALYGVSCAGSTRCLAAGLFFNSAGYYQTLAESWNGASVAIVNQDAQLAGVSCVNAVRCVSVGSDFSRASVSVTLAELWNGTSWWVVPTPNPAKSEGSYLTAVTCLRADRCVAVGYYYAVDNSRKTLVESWNGVRWSIVASPNPAGAAYSVLYAVSCDDGSQCTAVGSAAGRVLAESWNGSRWAIVPTADPPTTAYAELTGISCDSASHCLAVGYETDTYYHADLTLAEEWTGSAWTIVPSAAPGKTRSLSSVLHGMSCGADGGCMAVGYGERDSGGFATLTERWTGTRWILLNSPSPARSAYSDLSAISCISTSQCLAVGTSLTGSGDFATLSERWTGTEWDIVATPASASPPFGIAYLQGISCAASFRCLAAGTSGSPANLRTLSEWWDGSMW